MACRCYSRIRCLFEAVPLRLKIMGMVVGTALLIAVLTAFQVRRAMTDEIFRQLRERSCSTALEFASRAPEYVLVNDIFGLTRLFKDAVSNRRDLRYAFMISPKGEVVAHSFSGGFPMELLSVESPNPSEEVGGAARVVTDEGVVWDCSAQVMRGMLGRVRVGISTERAQRTIDSLVRSMIFTIGVVAMAGLLFSALLTWFLTRPIAQLAQAAARIRRGDYDIHLESCSTDEIGSLVAAFNDMAVQLAEAERVRQEREALRKEYLRKIIEVQEEERRRVARELHDQVAQALVALRLDLKLIENAKDPKVLSQRIQRLRQTIAYEMEAIHELALALRPPVLDDMGLLAALEHYVKEYSARYDFSIDFLAFGLEEVRLESYIETAVYRIVQEALANIARHAQAENATIILELVDGTELRGVIHDDGQGFDVSKRGVTQMGLYGMEERVHLLGGKISIDSRPGEGTVISFSIPVGDRGGGHGEDHDSHSG